MNQPAKPNAPLAIAISRTLLQIPVPDYKHLECGNAMDSQGGATIAAFLNVVGDHPDETPGPSSLAVINLLQKLASPTPQGKLYFQEAVMREGLDEMQEFALKLQTSKGDSAIRSRIWQDIHDSAVRMLDALGIQTQQTSHPSPPPAEEGAASPAVQRAQEQARELLARPLSEIIDQDYLPLFCKSTGVTPEDTVREVVDNYIREGFIDKLKGLQSILDLANHGTRPKPEELRRAMTGLLDHGVSDRAALMKAQGQLGRLAPGGIAKKKDFKEAIRVRNGMTMAASSAHFNNQLVEEIQAISQTLGIQTVGARHAGGVN